MADLVRNAFLNGEVRATKQVEPYIEYELNAVHESANRFMYMDDEYDVVTVSQALETRAARASTGETTGAFDRAILHFRRGGARYDASRIDAEPVMPIAWEPRGARDL